jgi:hypothetical protein
LEELCRYTRKEQAEIQQVFKYLRDQDVITIQDEKISEFRKNQAWDLLNEQLFFSERRG